ncbi:MAG: phage tail sheath protein [Selenomonadaceae bacterium]|nr:phage tail sheath protein [Selenomonadaceae bacterium]
MAYSSTLGLPQIFIDFQSSASTAMIRSSRGIATMILNDENVTDDTGLTFFKVTESADIPSTGISDKNVDLIKKGLAGTPAQLNIFLIPNSEYDKVIDIVTSETVATTTTIESEVFVVGVEDIDDPDLSTEDHYEIQPVTVETETIVTGTTTSTVTVEATITQAAALKEIGDLKFNWICHPTGGAQDQEDLATWTAGQRKTKNKTFKAVVAKYNADNYGVVNFTTDNIRVVNPDYTDALAEVGGDAELVDEDIPQYVTYTAAEYTSRITGALAGIGLDRSPTYLQFPEIVDCKRYDDIDTHINAGELCLFDEHDGNGVKIARGCNSLTTFTAKVGESFRYIKIVEAIDMIADDIASTFRSDYVGKVLNTYDNKMLFISAIMVYLNQLKELCLITLKPPKTTLKLTPTRTKTTRKFITFHLTNTATNNSLN